MPVDLRDFATRLKLAYAQDTFARANQSGWGTDADGDTWQQRIGSSTLAISGNQGTATGTNSLNVMTLGSYSLADVEVLVRVSATSTSDVVGVVLRQDATLNTQYRVRTTSTGLSIVKVVGSVTSPALASGAFTWSGGSLYWIRARILGSNIYGKMWADGTAEPTAWLVSANDSTLTGANYVGVFNNLNTNGHTATFDHFSIVEAKNPVYPSVHDVSSRFRMLDTVTWDVPARFRLRDDYTYRDGTRAPINSSPYGVTFYMGGNAVQAPPQLITDMQTLGLVWGRIQLRWALVESNPANPVSEPPTNTPVYDWSVLDKIVTQLNNAGINYLFPIQNAPDNYLIVDGSGNYPVTPQKSGGTGVLPAAQAFKRFATAVANRYNGTVNSPYSGKPMIIQALQIGNEEWDTSSPRDSRAFVPIIAAAAPAIRSAYPNCSIGICAVRRTPSGGAAHIQNWLDQLFIGKGNDGTGHYIQYYPSSGSGGLGKLIDWVDFHYYRDGTTDASGNFVPDPTQSTYDKNGNLNCPNVSTQLSIMSTVIANHGYTTAIMCNETGWNIYDDGTGTSNVNTPAKQSEYILDMMDAMRKQGGYKCMVWEIAPGATVNTSNNPQTSTAPNSITQNIGNTYTYEPAFTNWKAYIQQYPSWNGTTVTTSTRDISTRLKLKVVSPSDISTRFVLQLPNTRHRNIASRFVLATKTIKDIATRFILADTANKDWNTRFRLATVQPRDFITRLKLQVFSTRDIKSRFKLKSISLHDWGARVIIGAPHISDWATRLRLQVFAARDIASRLRYADTRAWDLKTRFNLGIQQIRDISTRLKLQVFSTKDIAARFHLKLSNSVFKDFAARLKLAATQTRDWNSRFKLQVTKLADIASRLRMSDTRIATIAARFLLQVFSTRDVKSRFYLVATPQKDIATRFVQIAKVSKDVAARLLLQVTPVRDIAARLKLQVTPLRDVASRLKLAATQTRDISTRLKLGLALQSIKDMATRMRLATVQTRDWNTRLKLLTTQIRDWQARVKLKDMTIGDIGSRLNVGAQQNRDVMTRFRVITFSTQAPEVMPVDFRDGVFAVSFR